MSEITNLLIREATPEDAQAMLDYGNLVGGESPYLTFGAEGLGITLEEEVALLTRMQTDPFARMYLAILDGEIVGMASYSRMRRPRLEHRASLALSVRRSHWGRGIGTQLMRELLAVLKALGCTLVTLEVISENERALRLYESLGFTYYGELDDYLRVDGVPHAARFMKLTLQ